MNGTLNTIKKYWFLITALGVFIAGTALNRAQVETNAVEINELQVELEKVEDKYHVIMTNLELIKKDVSYLRKQEENNGN